MSEQGNGNGTVAIWKNCTLFLAGVVLTLGGAWITTSHDTVSRAEIPVLTKQYTDEMVTVREQNARLEIQVNQLQVDVARISERLGVSAHPSDKR